MSLGSRIATAVRRERERAGVSAAELARRSGVSKATISQIEAGSANPNVETLWAIATALAPSLQQVRPDGRLPPPRRGTRFNLMLLLMLFVGLG